MESPAAAGLRRAMGPLPQWPPCNHSECPQRDGLVLAALDGFAAHVALLDSHGVIRAANQHWREFAAQAGDSEASATVGTNYLEACRRARGTGSPGAADVAAALERVLTAASEACEFPYRCDTAAGTRWFKARLVPFDTGAQSGILITHEDITNRKATRETLSDVAHHTIEGVMVVRAGGVVEWVDDALLSMTGLRRDTSVGRTLESLLQGHSAAWPVLETIREAIAADAALTATVPVLRTDGQVLMVEVRVEPVEGDQQRFVATLADVTERRLLEHAIATVADDERQALAREVHEGLGHELTAARLIVSLAINKCASDPQARDLLVRAEAAIERAAAMARAIEQGIVPLDRGVPLVTALEILSRNMSVPGVVSVSFTSSVKATPAGAQADQLYRICQEAVANAVRHARARHVGIVLADLPMGVLLRVTDDGSGFESSQDKPGQGLRLMKLRASSLGGTLSIESTPGQGTVVTCTVGA